MRKFLHAENPPQKRNADRAARSGMAPEARMRTSELVQLQRLVGNQALARRQPPEQSASRRPSLAAAEARLPVTTPGDRYEQEADRAAQQVMRIREPQSRPPDEIKHTSVLSSVRQSSGGSGEPLDPSSRLFMESRFGHEFSGVRIHTSTEAGASAQALKARAYTVGQDIIFGPGQYSIHSHDGKFLLAHELAHVVQQTALPKAQSHGTVTTPEGEPVLPRAPKVVSRWFDLGYTSWTTTFGTVVVHHWVGSEAEWRAVLKDADNEETYRTYLQGFLSLAADPSLVSQIKHPAGFPDFVNTVSRAPNRGEIMAFMRALYGLASDLDMTPLWFAEEFFKYMKGDIEGVIEKYQGELIKEISTKSPLTGSVVVDDDRFKAVASEGGAGVSTSMINSAIHTSQEGIATLIVAAVKNDKAGKDRALTIILNAAKVIRFTLDVKKARLAEAEKMNSLLLDVIFGDILQLKKIPFVKALTERLPAITHHLLNTANQMAVSAMMSDDPEKQALSIDKTFIDQVKQLGPNGLQALDAVDTGQAITHFGSGISMK